jgi:hypothetical protein
MINAKRIRKHKKNIKTTIKQKNKGNHKEKQRKFEPENMTAKVVSAGVFGGDASRKPPANSLLHTKKEKENLKKTFEVFLRNEFI